MKTIHKYPVPLHGESKIAMPVHAKILHVGEQDQRIYLWAEVDPQYETEIRMFTVAGTGFHIEDHLVHVGTVQIGAFVWHVYEHKTNTAVPL